MTEPTVTHEYTHVTTLTAARLQPNRGFERIQPAVYGIEVVFAQAASDDLGSPWFIDSWLDDYLAGRDLNTALPHAPAPSQLAAYLLAVFRDTDPAVRAVTVVEHDHRYTARTAP